MASNPVSVPMNQTQSGQISCQANAAYYQRVTLEWNVLHDTNIVIFTGTGEGVPMQTDGGATQYNLAPTRQGYSINAFFEYSPNGPAGPFYEAVVQDPIITPSGNSTKITITSEDSNDNDNNDSVLTILYQPL